MLRRVLGDRREDRALVGDARDVARVERRAAFEHVDVRVGEGRQQHATGEIHDARVPAGEGGGPGDVADVDDAAPVHRDGFRHASLRVGRVDAAAAEHPIGPVAAARGRGERQKGPKQRRISSDTPRSHGCAGWPSQGAGAGRLGNNALPILMTQRARRCAPC